ncbi:pyridoxamine 5'-phosphate oxidase [Puia dinghuensis]|uniref:Pyridoxine/pyridoxamine 5'-phosphate oxidase n=1 Tax=Puia dinghuensis TaxID=1792502 RepID=A0A8J2UG75_9BACT|nr:pyridoxamine 5'-phosphate oxidase [Puia dinghuensis]GGB12351.1 pyridoxine/pyridoxamine 5'-phosphate oxidase [Puia dinghuensis]
MSTTIADIRKEYKLQTLSEKDVLQDPFAQFNKWWQEAINAGIDEVNAMTLATASADGMPDARIVLLKGVSEKGFAFYTNYNSAKGQQLLENPRATLVFFWKELERQIRISGLVSLTPDKMSDDYFNSRPEGSRIGAWASPQSEPIESREWLEANEEKIRQEFTGKTIPRPEHWGGYVVKPVRMEFWQGRPSRLHDRFLYSLQNTGSWTIERLAP